MPAYDPTFLNARREALLILMAWAVCLVWTVGVSAWLGYGVPAEEIPLVWGIPHWVVWGVLVPWGAATAFSIWFALVYMTDDDLGEMDPEPEVGSDG